MQSIINWQEPHQRTVRLTIVPLTLTQANEMVRTLHRHHKPALGHRFSIGVKDSMGILHGAAIIGRPVARGFSPYEYCEVNRLVTDGTYNVCSKLYSAAARIAKEMGFIKIITYILESENGASLKASGWVLDALTRGGDWNVASRGGRRTDQPQEPKQRWVKICNP